MNHQNYFDNAYSRRKRAKEWTEYVAKKYESQISTAISSSTIYNEHDVFEFEGSEERTGYDIPCEVLVKDSVSGVIDAVNAADTKVCVLNFASYKEAGGKFIEGSKAQEECLCHESFLYNVLTTFKDKYYEKNCQAKNKALYLNRAIYTPRVTFERDKEAYIADVLTCAAPNYAAAKKYCAVGQYENENVLYSRIEFCLDIMQQQKVDIPVLGAYGCGVFGQDARVVASMFKKLLTKKKYTFGKVIFAVIAGPNANDFLAVFGNHLKDQPENQSKVEGNQNVEDFVNTTALNHVDVSEDNRPVCMYQINFKLIARHLGENPYNSTESENKLDVICIGTKGLENFINKLKAAGKIVSVQRDEKNFPVKMMGPVSVHDAGYTKRRLIYTPELIPSENIFE